MYCLFWKSCQSSGFLSLKKNCVWLIIRLCCHGGPVKTILCLLGSDFAENLLNLWVSYTLEGMQMKSTALSIIAIAYFQKNWVCPHVWSCHLLLLGSCWYLHYKVTRSANESVSDIIHSHRVTAGNPRTTNSKYHLISSQMSREKKCMPCLGPVRLPLCRRLLISLLIFYNKDYKAPLS